MKSIFFLFFIILGSSLSFGFELRPATDSNPNSFRKWDTSSPIIVNLNLDASDDLSQSDVEVEIQEAIGTWRQVTGSFQLTFGGVSSAAAANNTDRVNSILWVESDWDYSSSTLAITKHTYILDGSYHLIDSDILFNGRDFGWGRNLKVNYDDKVEFQQVLLHELGHLLGLSHTAVYKASLYPYLPAKVSLKLNKDDKAGVRFLYDAPGNEFEPISPVQKASYPIDLMKRGLPAPTFRWNGAGKTNFALEFSTTSDFAKKVSFSSGTACYYTLTSKNLEKILSISARGKIYWRIVSEGISTKPQLLKFKTV